MDAILYSPDHWLAFFAAALALNLAPGPDLAFVLSTAAARGRRAGFAASLGVCSGALVHVLAVAAGLSAVLVASAWAFTAVKLAGAAYLVYLGVQALRSRPEPVSAQPGRPRPASPWAVYRQGVFIDVLNPKVAVFFMAFLPQFAEPGRGNLALQLFVLGGLVIALGLAVEAGLILAASRAARFLGAKPRISLWLERLLGLVFIGLAVRLATERQ